MILCSWWWQRLLKLHLLLLVHLLLHQHKWLFPVCSKLYSVQWKRFVEFNTGKGFIEFNFSANSQLSYIIKYVDHLFFQFSPIHISCIQCYNCLSQWLFFVIFPFVKSDDIEMSIYFSWQHFFQKTVFKSVKILIIFRFLS